MRENQAGFSLVELLIGTAIAAVVIGGLVTLASRLTLTTSALDARVQGQSAAERLLERLTAEAASAWAVYVPASDLNGNPNVDGHEIDFFSEDGSHRPYSWAYTFDAAQRQLTRYAYAPGVTPSAGETIAPVDAFAAKMITMTQLGTVDPLFAGATATPVSYGFDAAPAAVGGNALVQVQIAGPGVDRSELLASATAPTTFTVVIEYTPSPVPIATATPIPLLMTPATP